MWRDHMARRLVCVMLLVLSVPHIARIVRDLCVCSMGLMVKSGARSCQDADQRLGCHRAVLFSRGRSNVQEHMKAEHWPAKQVICKRNAKTNALGKMTVFGLLWPMDGHIVQKKKSTF